ncbi:MAG: hypothetical protein WDW36_000748 [Sanguina aurantia]
MVETRSATSGQASVAPGGYNTDKYYDGLSDGAEGNMGIGQEPDAGKLDDGEDKSYKPSSAENADATAGQNEPLPDEGNASALKAEAGEMKNNLSGECSYDGSVEGIAEDQQVFTCTGVLFPMRRKLDMGT